MPRSPQDEITVALDELDQHQTRCPVSEAALNQIISFAQRAFNVPFVQIDFSGALGTWSTAELGIEGFKADIDATFWVDSEQRKNTVVVLDATKNECAPKVVPLANFPLVGFYAGVPLKRSDGHHLGSLFISDPTPREHFDKNAQTTLIELASLTVEILALSQGNRELQISEGRHRIVSQTASDAMVTIDEQSTILFLNPAASKIFGHQLNDMLGQSLTMLMPEYLRHVHEAGLKRNHETGKRHISWEAVEVPGLHKDGHEIDLEISFGEYKQEGRHLFTAIIRDITERKRAEVERIKLHASEHAAWLRAAQVNKRLTFLVEASQILASSLNYQETLRRVAKSCVPGIADWCALDVLTVDGKIERLAVTHKDPEKVRWALRLQERYPPASNTPVHQVLATGQPAFYRVVTEKLIEQLARDSEHLELLRKVGFSSAMIVPLVAREQVFGTLTLVYAEAGKHYDEEDLRLAQELARRAAIAVDNARLYGQAQDLNELLESKVRQRTAQYEAANRELEAFSYSVSHDLRAPLRGIDGFSKALLEDYGEELDSTAKRYLDRIRAGTQRMGTLIDDLLNLARLSRIEIARRTVDLTSVAELIAEELKGRQPDRQVAFTIAKGMVTEGDERLLGVVLQNLLENAWKFTAKRDGAEIKVGSCPSTDGQTVFFVHDNGAGFDPAYADKLFGAFQRLHSPAEFEGTGIGLATVQRIILRHGGRIWAESTPGEGATFFFTGASASEDGEVRDHDPR